MSQSCHKVVLLCHNHNMSTATTVQHCTEVLQDSQLPQPAMAIVVPPVASGRRGTRKVSVDMFKMSFEIQTSAHAGQIFLAATNAAVQNEFRRAKTCSERKAVLQRMPIIAMPAKSEVEVASAPGASNCACSLTLMRRGLFDRICLEISV